MVGIVTLQKLNEINIFTIIISFRDGGYKIKNSQNCCSVISINIRNCKFINYSHQRKLYFPTDLTKRIKEVSYNYKYK